MTFLPGQSGNPAGRPPGSRNKRSLISEAMLEGEPQAVMRRLVDTALDGDLRAIRLLIDRLEPVRKERPIEFNLPPVKEFKDSVAVFAAIGEAVAGGELMPSEAESLIRIVDRQVAALEKVEIREMIRAGHEAAQKTHD
jgi:Family of unknown function (DUF5681)